MKQLKELEIKENQVKIKNLKTQEQYFVSLEKLYKGEM